MTLPPVVSDAEVCSFESGQPHEWRTVLPGDAPYPHGEYVVCRWCGGRKPTDAAPSSEGRGVEG